MRTDKVIKGEKIYLRQIQLTDCTETYVNWLNDTQVNQYLETKWQKQDLSTITEFVNSQIKSDGSVLFAIIENTSLQHIGNIKIGPINKNHNHADISYFIGDKSMWGKGIATEAIRLIVKYGFEDLNLHRIEAGAYCRAIGSWKALEKNGFKREAIFREHVFFVNEYIDVYRYGMLKDEYNKRII